VSRCRARRVDPELTRLAVFVETGTGDIEQMTALACQVLRAWHAELVTDLERLHANPSAFPEEAARVARMRRNPPLPRRVRMRLEERELAVLSAFTRMLGTPLSEREAAQGEFQLLRSLGLKSGRGPIGGMTDLMPSEAEWPPRPGALADALASVGSERIELGRRLAEVALVWMPALRSVWLAEFGAGAVPLVDILAAWSQHVGPGLCVMMLGAFVSGGSVATDEEIREGLAEFAPEVAALQLLADRPAAEWKLAGDRLRPYQRARLVAAAGAVGIAP
jgi:hypothetical protein